MNPSIRSTIGRAAGWVANRLNEKDGEERSMNAEITRIHGEPVLIGVHHGIGPDPEVEDDWKEFCAEYETDPVAILGLALQNPNENQLAKVDVLLSEAHVRKVANGFAELDDVLGDDKSDSNGGEVGFQ